MGALGRAASGVRRGSFVRASLVSAGVVCVRVALSGGGGLTAATSKTRCLRTVTDRGNPTV